MAEKRIGYGDGWVGISSLDSASWTLYHWGNVACVIGTKCPTNVYHRWLDDRPWAGRTTATIDAEELARLRESARIVAVAADRFGHFADLHPTADNQGSPLALLGDTAKALVLARDAMLKETSNGEDQV